MDGFASPFYPPRARWYSPLLCSLDRWRGRLALDRLNLPSGVSCRAAIASLLVPGLGFAIRGPSPWGRAALGLALFLALVFLVCLGHLAGNIAFALLLSLHVTSVTYLFEPWLAGARFRARIGFSGIILALLACALYLPIRDFVQTHLFMPLRVKGRVLIVHRVALAPSLRAGDWVAYTFSERGGGGGVVVRGGYGLGPVLALPGDHVRFTPTALQVNGADRPRLPFMPQSGGFVLPQKQWLVWPDLAIGGHGHTPGDVIAATYLDLGRITQDQMIGRPFRRWFGRRQF